MAKSARSKPPSVEKYTFAVGRTINIGNFESVRIDVGGEISVTGNHDDVFEILREDVESKLNVMVQETLDNLEE